MPPVFLASPESMDSLARAWRVKGPRRGRWCTVRNGDTALATLDYLFDLRKVGMLAPIRNRHLSFKMVGKPLGNASSPFAAGCNATLGEGKDWRKIVRFGGGIAGRRLSLDLTSYNRGRNVDATTTFKKKKIAVYYITPGQAWRLAWNYFARNRKNFLS